MMMTVRDKVKRFKILLLSPHVLTDDEMRALWTIAKYENKIIFRPNVLSGTPLDTNPIIWTARGPIIISRHIVGTLERRGILKRHYAYPHIPSHISENKSYYTWAIVWKKVKTFKQTKELRIQYALGSI